VREKIEGIVRQVVNEYVVKHKPITKNKNKQQIFLLIDDHPIPVKAKLWNGISQLSKQYNITICSPDNVHPLVNVDHEHIELNSQNYERILKKLESINLFILVNPQYSNLAKLALSIDDTFASWLTLQMQLSGKKILFLRDTLSQDSTHLITAPHYVQDRIQTYMRQLLKEKIQFVKSDQLESWLLSYFESDKQKRNFVLAKHIKQANDLGEKEVVAPKGSIITPMGKELAKDLDISIKLKE
jgi:hypothetical protein